LGVLFVALAVSGTSLINHSLETVDICLGISDLSDRVDGNKGEQKQACRRAFLQFSFQKEKQQRRNTSNKERSHQW